MKICHVCRQCVEDNEVSCARHPFVPLEHEREGSCIIDGKYRLDYRVGRGGNGAVYKCTHVELQQPRAMKLLRPDSPDPDPYSRLRLRREALTACRFDHPNVVRIYDFGTNIISIRENGEVKTVGELYIVMEFISGQTLKEYLKENNPLPVEEAVAIAIQIADGLAEVHGQGVIIRDVKPENAMLPPDRNGRRQVKLVDFGAVKLSGQVAEEVDPDLTRGMFIGTALYASPELCKGTPLDERSDIYSLGVILYEMLAGCTPFLPSDWAKLLYQHAHMSPPPLENVPPALASLVDRTLSKNPDERPQSAAEFATILRDFAHSSVISPTLVAKTAFVEALTLARGEAGEEEETRYAPLPRAGSIHNSNLYGTNSGVTAKKKVADQGLKAGGKSADAAKVSSPPAAGQPKGAVQGRAGRKAGRPATDASMHVAGLRITPRTFAATILLIASLAGSLFQLWRLAQAASPEATQVEAVGGSDADAPPTVSSEVGDELITTTDVNIRFSHSGKSKVIGLAEKGSRVRILEKHRNWRRVSVIEHGRDKEDPESADQGWIYGDYLAMPDNRG